MAHFWFIFEGLVLLPFGSHFAALEMKLSWLGTGPGLGGSRNRAGQFDRAHSFGKIDEKSTIFGKILNKFIKDLSENR